MLTVLGGLAEFERDLIRARTSEGRERAKARGVKLGRKPKLTEHQKREAIRRRDHGSLCARSRAARMSATARFPGWKDENLLCVGFSFPRSVGARMALIARPQPRRSTGFEYAFRPFFFLLALHDFLLALHDVVIVPA